MSNSGAGGGERTEKATPERLKKARQDGSIGKSQDLSGWVVVGAGAVMIPMAMDNACRRNCPSSVDVFQCSRSDGMVNV